MSGYATLKRRAPPLGAGLGDAFWPESACYARSAVTSPSTLSKLTRRVSLAWMLRKYPNVVPIPGSKNKQRTIENLDAWNVRFTDEEFSELENELDRIPVHGHRGSVQVEGSKMSDWGKD